MFEELLNTESSWEFLKSTPLPIAVYGTGNGADRVFQEFEKLGITEINPEGETFDPNLHNAVMHVEDEALGESVVVEVLQKGYCRGERVLRYAMVKVAN